MDADDGPNHQGGGGNDVLWGRDGDDQIISFDLGRDLIWGGNGNDTISASGLDTAIGGLGNDVLSLINGPFEIASNAVATGGFGRDTFEAGDGPNSLHDVFTFTDFSSKDDQALITWSAGDRINVVQLLASDLGPSGAGSITGDVDQITFTQHSGSTNDDQIVVKGGADWMHVG